MTTQQPQLSLLTTVTSNLNVRCGPGTDADADADTDPKPYYPEVGFIAVGSTKKYDILGKYTAAKTWYQIRFDNNIIGWVQGNHVQTHGSLTGIPVAWVGGPQLSLKGTTTYNLNARAKPDAASAKLGFIPGGSTTRYDLLAKNAATATWYRIRFSASVTGWVHANYVRTHGSLVGLPIR